MLKQTMQIEPLTLFTHYLQQLDRILEKSAAHADSEAELLNARLAEGMFPLSQQARTAIDFSLRALCPLIGEEIRSFANERQSFTGIRMQLAETLDYLAQIDSSRFEGAETRQVTTRTGFREHAFSGADYLALYALPNFLFHLNMVYALARQQGVPLSKGDYDDFHQYPDGFRF
ncbi:DUF1993 domain-containing protein [Marinobacterium arenosum]|uniref:DUF1993 domain-containing protein n=1 Tax=Marinobacterium arenosum TaxID=2862496 RepID=UPI001C9858E3|nr:DUF1993 domain-containing protein [Marinobacterium arenosum]MBY4677230.1 DUF1993 domain-containing protein [Marinobacterium arenosum]